MDFVKLTSLFSLTQAFPTEDSCLTYLEQHFWKDGVISPFDPTSKVYTLTQLLRYITMETISTAVRIRARISL